MYLQIDEGFVGHPKTRAFAGRMQDQNAAMYLIKLWTWAVRSAPTGDLSEMNPWSIEDVVGYRHLDGKCYAAMVACGFIDEEAPGAPKCIHNWAKRTGGDIVKMENEANRKRLLRAHKNNQCDPATCQFHRRADDAPPDVPETSGGRPEDKPGTSAGHPPPKQHQDKSSQGQSRQDPDLPSPLGPLGSVPDPAGARSNGKAKIWSAWDWKNKFGIAWVAKYQTGGYGEVGDSKACGALGLLLETLPAEELLAAQERAPAMFAEFLASADPKTVARRHPFTFFAQEWGGLRVPKKATAPPGEPPWKAHQREEEQRKGADRAAARVAQQQLDRELAEAERKAAAG